MHPPLNSGNAKSATAVAFVMSEKFIGIALQGSALVCSKLCHMMIHCKMASKHGEVSVAPGFCLPGFGKVLWVCWCHPCRESLLTLSDVSF